MKSFIRTAVFTTGTLFVLSSLFPEVRFANTLTMFCTGVLLAVLFLVVRPFLKILFLPVNIITFGLFAWMLNVIVLYIATLLIPGFHIGAITISPITIGMFVFPEVHLTTFWSYFLVSVLLSFGNGVLAWLL